MRRDLSSAMRREEIRAGAFADPLAHPAYLHRLVARAGSLSSLLLQDLLIRGQHTDSVVENELAPASQCRQRLFFGSRRRLRVLALGGGPGFEGVAIASLAEFLGSTLDEIEVWIADHERSWERTAAAVHRAFEATRAEHGRRTAVRVATRFISADVSRQVTDSAPTGSTVGSLEAIRRRSGRGLGPSQLPSPTRGRGACFGGAISPGGLSPFGRCGRCAPCLCSR